ncbi:MAG TPA: large conductance mechanosensitive channel protein MscL [Flavobacteriaceae bacterium]|nr:large conductance mechanosensitive channel protein MscL [Flavobacteriaceae bacterium]
MGFIKNFKAFLLKKDIVALATAVIIGTALNAVVKSLVDDIIMPITGLFTEGVDFSNKFFALDGRHYESVEAAKEAGVAVLTYGNLVQAIINFIIIGLVVYFILKTYEKTKKKEEAAAPAGPSKEEVLLTEIRDELRKKNP